MELISPKIFHLTSLKLDFSDDNTLSVLIIVQHEGIAQFNSFCKKYDAINEEVGRITQEPTLSIASPRR